MLRLWFLTLAVSAEIAFERVGTLSTSADLWLRRLHCDTTSFLDPNPDFVAAPKRLLSKIALDEQALIIALARIKPTAVYMGEGNGLKRHPRGQRDKRLNGYVVMMIVFDARR